MKTIKKSKKTVKKSTNTSKPVTNKKTVIKKKENTEKKKHGTPSKYSKSEKGAELREIFARSNEFSDLLNNLLNKKVSIQITDNDNFGLKRIQFKGELTRYDGFIYGITVGNSFGQESSILFTADKVKSINKIHDFLHLIVI